MSYIECSGKVILMPKSPVVWAGIEAPSGANVAAIAVARGHTIQARLSSLLTVEDAITCVGPRPAIDA
jgi:hypothetical protein